MIDINTEDLEPLKKAPFPGRPHYSTRWRWATRGVGAGDGERIVLETAVIGGVRYTSKQARQRFAERATQARNAGVSPSAPRQTTREREAAIKRAEAQLADAGI